MIKIFKNRIKDWKTFLFDKEKLSLFISLLLFFPSPFFFIVLSGLTPTISLIFLGYLCKPDVGSLIFLILAFFIVTLNILINCFLLRIAVNIFFKIFDKLFKGELNRKIALTILIIAFISLSCSLDIYVIGDAGGGSHQYNFISLYKDILSGPY
jgi:hypothetical protein